MAGGDCVVADDSDCVGPVPAPNFNPLAFIPSDAGLVLMRGFTGATDERGNGANGAHYTATGAYQLFSGGLLAALQWSAPRAKTARLFKSETS